MRNEWWNKVKDFHDKFGHPIAGAPKFMGKKRALKRYKWMLEELDEFLEAENIIDQTDAMIDLIYFAVGTMVELGVEPDEVFEIVHNANMNKLWQDGKPYYNEDNKTIKPPNWVDPYPILKQKIESYKVEAKPYFCVASVLETIIKEQTNIEIKQNEIIEYLGLNVPSNYEGETKNINFTDDVKLQGVVLEKDSVNRLFEHFKIPLKEEYIEISMFQDFEFIDTLKQKLDCGYSLACGVSYGKLYDIDDKNDIGHVVQICSTTKGKVTVYDPGSLSKGYKEIDEYQLYIAIKFKRDGIWCIGTN